MVHGKSDAQTLAGREMSAFVLGEGLGQVSDLLVAHARAVVEHGDLNAAVRKPGRAHAEAVAAGAELQRVRRERQHHALDGVTVGADAKTSPRLAAQAKAARTAAFQAGQAFRDAVRQVELGFLKPGDARTVVDELQDILDHVAQRLAAGVDVPGVLLVSCIAERAICLTRQDVGRCDDRVERRTQFVAGGGDEGGFGASRRLDGGARLLQLGGHRLQAGDVAKRSEGGVDRREQPLAGEFRLLLVVVDVVVADDAVFRRLARLPGAQDDADLIVAEIFADDADEIEAGAFRLHDDVEQDNGAFRMRSKKLRRFRRGIGAVESQRLAVELEPPQRKTRHLVHVRLVIDDDDFPWIDGGALRRVAGCKNQLIRQTTGLLSRITVTT